MRKGLQFEDRKRLDAVVVRTDFSDDVAWQSVRDALAIGPGGDLDWPLSVTEWADATVDEVLDAIGGDRWLDVVFIADRAAMTDAEHKVLAVPIGRAASTAFRVVPGWVVLLHGTLAATDIGFDVFARSAARDSEGVFRGFHD